MFDIEVTLSVRPDYNQSAQVIVKKLQVNSFEEAARLIGKLLQHLPKGGK